MSSSRIGQTTWNTADSLSSSASDTLPPQDRLNQTYLSNLFDLEGVTRVYADFHDDHVTEYWILLTDEDSDLRRQIYHLDYDLFGPDSPYQIETHVFAHEDVADLNLSESARLIFEST